MKSALSTPAILIAALCAAQDNGVIAFGTKLVPAAQSAQSQAFAKSVAKPNAHGWQAKGDQRRTYRFPGTETEVPYRIYVPTTWDGMDEVPGLSLGIMEVDADHGRTTAGVARYSSSLTGNARNRRPRGKEQSS